jgi:hypothetical protein
LTEAGSNKDRILTVLVFITDMGQKDGMNRAWDEWGRPYNLEAGGCLRGLCIDAIRFAPTEKARHETPRTFSLRRTKPSRIDDIAAPWGELRSVASCINRQYREALSRRLQVTRDSRALLHLGANEPSRLAGAL